MSKLTEQEQATINRISELLAELKPLLVKADHLIKNIPPVLDKQPIEYVECVCNDSWFNSLTLGKIYKVNSESGDIYEILDNTGNSYDYFKTRFEPSTKEAFLAQEPNAKEEWKEKTEVFGAIDLGNLITMGKAYSVIEDTGTHYRVRKDNGDVGIVHKIYFEKSILHTKDVLSEEKEPIKEERWKPAYNESYYYVSLSNGIIINKDVNMGWGEDQNCLKIGNCFPTKEAAQIVADKIKQLLKEL